MSERFPVRRCPRPPTQSATRVAPRASLQGITAAAMHYYPAGDPSNKSIVKATLGHPRGGDIGISTSRALSISQYASNAPRNSFSLSAIVQTAITSLQRLALCHSLVLLCKGPGVHLGMPASNYPGVDHATERFERADTTFLTLVQANSFTCSFCALTLSFSYYFFSG